MKNTKPLKGVFFYGAQLHGPERTIFETLAEAKRYATKQSKALKPNSKMHQYSVWCKPFGYGSSTMAVVKRDGRWVNPQGYC